MAGPFKIIKQIGNLYEVKLLEIIKIYNVFSLDQLRKAIDDLLVRQINDLLLPIIVIIEEE
jgi:hypothetical protein